MIDRTARNMMAVLVRRLVACRITNDDFEEGVPASVDPAVRAVHGVAWSLYSDLETHRLDGARRIPKEGRREIARWILFLYSDEEYAWPQYDFVQIDNWPLNLLTFGWWETRKQRRFDGFKAAGELDFWPFISRESFENAASNPVLLTGRGRT